MQFPVSIPVDDQLSLALYRDEDAPEAFQLITSNRQHLATYLPWVDTIHTLADEQEALQILQQRAHEFDACSYAIRFQGQLVGSVGFHKYDEESRAIEIGYWLAKDAEGKGIITRSVVALLRVAFDEWRLNKVLIFCNPSNVRSCAIPQRLGFHFDGTLREVQVLHGKLNDLKMFSMLAREWAARSH